MRTFPRSFYYPKSAILVKDKNSSAIAAIYDSHDKPAACMFGGRRNKPDRHFTYKSTEARDAAVKKYFEQIQAGEKNKKIRREAAKNTDRGLEVGDVLRCSWGYEQTNVDYYQVTKLVGKSTVELTPISQDRIETGWMTGQCTPVPNTFTGAPFKKRAKNGSVRLTSYSWAYKIEPTIDENGSKVWPSSHWSSYH